MKQRHYLGGFLIALDVRRGTETADFPVTRRRPRWTGSSTGGAVAPAVRPPPGRDVTVDDTVLTPRR
ncbi:hypothetical protein GCM10010199_18310 [Dactylosporangium roseum]